MHIPDGYLSPSTCAVLYGTAIPFWYVAFARVKRLLNTRLIPLLALASAFCFVIMMFNLPLPGGTTGHAVGVGAATVVLGPWASMLSLSIALLIQAMYNFDSALLYYELNTGLGWSIVPAFLFVIVVFCPLLGLLLNVAVFRLADGRMFGVEDRCPHRGARLSLGVVYDGDKITCLDHGWGIRLVDGGVEAPEQGCVLTFPVKVEDGFVYLQI